MTASRPRHILIVVGLVLVALWCAQASDAQRGSGWLTPEVSFGGPTAQFDDELTSPGLVDVDAARHLREHVGAACLPAGRLATSPDPGCRDALTLDAQLTRPPPAV